MVSLLDVESLYMGRERKGANTINISTICYGRCKYTIIHTSASTICYGRCKYIIINITEITGFNKTIRIVHRSARTVGLRRAQACMCSIDCIPRVSEKAMKDNTRGSKYK